MLASYDQLHNNYDSKDRGFIGYDFIFDFNELSTYTIQHYLFHKTFYAKNLPNEIIGSGTSLMVYMDLALPSFLIGFPNIGFPRVNIVFHCVSLLL